MRITKEITARQIAAYLHHELSLAALVHWAEETLMDGEIAEGEMPAVTHVVSRLGVADVRAFGLTWEDCEELLRALGYAARVEVAVA